jgi:hypothetical protein
MSDRLDFDSMNETDVREIVVRPLIERLGYRHGTEATIHTEKILRYDRAFLGRKNPKKDPPLTGRADYVCEVISYGRWIVEVKAPSEELSQDVVEQAHTYASHPEIAASFFMVTNGRRFRLFETAKLQQAALEWDFEDGDDNLLRVFNTLSPAAFRKRASVTLVDRGKPLGRGIPSKLRVIGGEIVYEEHHGSHPFFKADSVNGLVLPVTGGYVARSEDKRIMGHVCVGKAAALMKELNAVTGVSDDYDFFSASEFLSDDPEHPTIFQNQVTTTVPVGKIMSLPGMPRIPWPLTMTSVSFTEAIGFVRDDKFIGTMNLAYDFRFSDISPQARMMLSHMFGAIPDKANMTGSGRFEISIQPDL